MDKVSELNDGIIKSKYYDVKYRPSMDGSNFKLDIACSSLLFNMALADITRDNDDINKLQEQFLEVLNNCKTDEELKNLATFLEMAANVGGYAKTFYSNNISMISNKSRDNSQQKVDENNKENPVSFRVDGGIKTKYYDVKYRPWDLSDKRVISCSSLLTYMALADITRDEDNINYLMAKFCEILTMCKTPEDFSNLSNYMNNIADVGGYAIEFNNKVKGLINEEGKKKAEQYIKDTEKHEKASSENLEDFKEKFKKINNSLTDLRESNVKDDDEVAYLLRKYNELQSDLYDFNGSVDKEFISKCDEQIEEAINYLKGLYRSLDEVKSASMGL